VTDFSSRLASSINNNERLAAERAEAEQQMDLAAEEAREAALRREAELAQARRERHAVLVEHLERVAKGLKTAATEGFVVRLGWTADGESYIAKLSSRTVTPSRTLFVELDRDDDEVLARWHSEVGSSLELWRLLEVGPELLEELVLQLADQSLWRGRTEPPPFPQPALPQP
jgi:hypothetical protein